MSAVPRVEDAVQGLRGSPLLRRLARLGLVARGVFYLLLAYLAASVAAGWGVQEREANANGALTTVAEHPLGLIALIAAAVGFLAFALARFAGAVGDHSIGRFRRLTTAGQGLFYLAMGLATLMFLTGRQSTGSSEQQRSTTAQLLHHPLGRMLLAIAGTVVVAVCLWQMLLAVRGGYADSLRVQDMSPRTRRAARIVGPIGIVARALAVLPVGVLLIAAALTDRASRAKDLDQLLAALNHSPGHVVVWLVAAGFLVFAAYSFIEVPYRNAGSGN